MIEPRALLHGAPHHAQKLVATLSAMRHFAAELRGDGFDVAYLRHDADEAEDLGTALAAHVRAFDPPEITAMRPTDHGVAGPVERAVQQAGSTMRWLPNASWITDDTLYDAWAEGRKTLRMEGFYREVRRATGILMEEGQPVGGRWNYDAENRQRPPPDATPPPFPSFEEDELTREVRREVEAAMPDRWGDADPFRWPVTRADALRALDAFVTERLARFGDYQDAMVEGEPTLWHSGLSVPLNLGLLHPREVVDAALAHADEHPSEVPLNALEGFVRQVAGWREFVRHAYRTRGEELGRADRAALPERHDRAAQAPRLHAPHPAPDGAGQRRAAGRHRPGPGAGLVHRQPRRRPGLGDGAQRDGDEPVRGRRRDDVEAVRLRRRLPEPDERPLRLVPVRPEGQDRSRRLSSDVVVLELHRSPPGALRFQPAHADDRGRLAKARRRRSRADRGPRRAGPRGVPRR